MIPVETTPGIGVERTTEDGKGGDLMYDIFNTL
jgi:hypothetical protein